MPVGGVALISITKPWARSVDEFHFLPEIGASVSQTAVYFAIFTSSHPLATNCYQIYGFGRPAAPGIEPGPSGLLQPEARGLTLSATQTVIS